MNQSSLSDTSTPVIVSSIESPDPTDTSIAIIRTSDRSMFKRCRRKWNFESGMRMNLGPIDRPSYFWIGTGGHFALEDYHGHNYYGDPVTAFNEYCDACAKAANHSRIKLPDDHEEQRAMGTGVLTHYLDWGKERDTLETVWMDGNPCVEVKCHITLPIPEQYRATSKYTSIVYQMTLDRLVIIDGEYWILDWKFFKQFSQGSLDFNAQMSAYIWAAQAMWDVPIAGAIYHEFKKKIPLVPRVLKNGDISTAKNQDTTHGQYRDVLIAKFGSVHNSPAGNISCLNDIALCETPDNDKFIRRSYTRRTTAQMQSEGTRVMMELEEMLDPNLALYTNPTRDCSWDCQFSEACLLMDRDDDWEGFLKSMSVSRTIESDDWRQYLRE